MKVLLLAYGSRGDVQPFLALAHRLAEQGRRPLLAAPARFAGLADEYAVPFHPLDDALLDMQDLAAGGTRAAVTAARRATTLLRRVLDTAAPAIQAADADVVVHHPKALAGPHLAEAAGVPAVAATLLPLYVPTREFPLPLLPNRVPRMMNRATWRLVSAIDAPYRRMIRRWRRDVLGLPADPPVDPRADGTARSDAGLGSDILHAWSGHLLPAPSDWSHPAHPIGSWHLPASASWTPSPVLRDFLDDGEPPVYIGFGSMVERDPVAVTRTVLEAVRSSGVRAVLATGWGGLRDSEQRRDQHSGQRPGDDVLFLDQAPHDWLFPRVSAVVHHGGAGTVAAAARAGRPQIIRPLMADQPFWAARVRALGLGPAPLARKFTADQLRAAIDDATKQATIAKAVEAVGTAMRAEDGMTTAIRRLERKCQTTPSR